MIGRIAGCFTALLLLGSAASAQDKAIQIGLVDSLIDSLSPGKKDLIDSEFQGLVQDFTGFKSQVHKGGTPFEAAQKLEAGAWDLAVMQGVEFGWAKTKNPKLEPLMIAVNDPRAVQATLVTKKEATLSDLKELKGKKVHILDGKEHVRLYVDKSVGGDAKSFFGKLTPMSSAEKALDEVILGKADAAIVDNVALQSYKNIHPGRFARVKVAAQSEPFPPAVIAYHPGKADQKMLDRFREGMLKANSSDKGRDAMANFRIDAFEAPQAEFARSVAEILKAYPAPAK